MPVYTNHLSTNSLDANSFHVFVISFHVSINIVTYSTCNTFFLPLQHYQLIDLILLWSWLLVMLLLDHRNEQGQAHIFQDTYNENCLIRQLEIMYSFEHTNHNFRLIFYKKIFTNSFCVHVICISNIFHV